MNEGTAPSESRPALDTATRLAYERTYLAYERTQMGWVRTALALISFGFTIAKFFEYLHEKQGKHGPVMGPQTVGVIMISIGLVALVLSGLQHLRALKILRQACPGLPLSLSTVTAALLGLLGVLALIGAILRS